MAGELAPLVEIFTSVQGEGRHVGVPMTFVRAAVCPIRCLYCDTPESYDAPAEFPVRGVDAELREANPVSGGRAAELAASVTPRGVRWVSVTGGEPLLYPGFVTAIGEALRGRGCSVHLESAALHPAALRQCVGALDHLSADYKLAGTLDKGDFRQQHRACVEVGVGHGITVDVKLVLTAAVSESAFETALEDMADFRDAVVLILQPVTPFGRVREPMPGERLGQWMRRARDRGFSVRVLPQVHKLLGLP